MRYTATCQEAISEALACLLAAPKLAVLGLTPRGVTLLPGQLHTLGMLPLTELRLNSYVRPRPAFFPPDRNPPAPSLAQAHCPLPQAVSPHAVHWASQAEAPGRRCGWCPPQLSSHNVSGC